MNTTVWVFHLTTLEEILPSYFLQLLWIFVWKREEGGWEERQREGKSRGRRELSENRKEIG
jgi:hypothetical protein